MSEATFFSRVYQGRVSSVSALQTSGRGKKAETLASKLPDWQELLGAHHTLVQHGTNYYLTAIAAMAGEDSAALFGLRGKMREAWGPYVGKGGKRYEGMRRGVAAALGLDPAKADFDEACAVILKGNEAAAETLRAVVLNLLANASGDGAIRQGGREFLPLLCNPSSGANSKTDPLMLKREYELAKLPHVLAAEGLRHTDGVLGEFSMFSIATPSREASAKIGAEARALLHTALAGVLEVTPDLKERSAALLQAIPALPDELSIPAYVGSSAKGSYKPWLQAMLLWQFLEKSELTLELLKRTAPVPKGKLESLMPPAPGGADPMREARGQRGYVFPAFTALAGWQPNEQREPQFIELDIALFKHALTVVSAYRAKTQERKEKREKAKREVAYMRGLKDMAWPGDAGAEPRQLRAEKIDLIEKRLIPALRPVDLAQGSPWSYTFGERTLRGYDELVEKWRRIAPKGIAFSKELHAELKEALNLYQETHRESQGSAHLFNCLIGGTDKARPVGDFWPVWQEDEDEDEDEDLLRHYGDLQEKERELEERLRQPIRFTPADAAHSRRLFMASDLNGKSKHVHGSDADGTYVDISVAVQTEGAWAERRVRLHYSAPRLARDQIEGQNRWLPPMLAASLKLGEAPQQDFASCAVTLMPDAVRAEDGSIKWERFLLNFPLELDVTQLPGRAARVSRWQYQFNWADGANIHLHWPSTRRLSTSKKIKETTPWHEQLESFSCLGVDLGQRAAAAVARIEASRRAGFAPKVGWQLGTAQGQEWRAKLGTLRMLCLPGEEAEVARMPAKHEEGKGVAMRQELHGNAGRCASEADCREAEEIVEALGLTHAFCLRSEREDVRVASPDAQRYFPWQNDFLLRALGRAQGRLARLQGMLYRIRQEKGASVAEELNEPLPAHLADQPVDPLFQELRLLVTAKEPQWPEIQQRLVQHIENLKKVLPAQLVRIANRVLPVRDGEWTWVPLGGEPLNHQLRLERDPKQKIKRKIAGQRGLSIERLEQLEELRKRCQSLNRALQRKTGDGARFGRDAKDLDLPDPCPEILERLEQLKEQRVNQTAHLILAEAMGLKLVPPTLTKEERRRRDVHGEYEQAKEPVDFIVIEDLNRYLTSQGKAPSENRRLMKWCHRAITDKLKQLCEPLGMTVVEVGAAYSSRFSSRNGVAGFRAREVSVKDFQSYPLKDLIRREGKRSTDESKAAKVLHEMLSKAPKGTTMLWPKPGGPIFVPMSGAVPMQADLNAAINIALRAVAAPESVHLQPRLRAEMIKGQLLPKVENQKETALFTKTLAAFSGDPGETKDRGTNVFVDLGPVAEFGQLQHSAVGHALASGKGLWGAVKQGQHKRCKEINKQRLCKKP